MPGEYDLSADRFILKNVRVLTPDGNGTVPASVGVASGWIMAVGGLDEVRAITGRGAAEIDLERAMVLPGFWESHLHLVDGALFLAQIDLRGCETPSAIAARLREPMSALKGGGWALQTPGFHVGPTLCIKPLDKNYRSTGGLLGTGRGAN